MSGPLSNAPVYYALAQAKFNPVAAMDDYASKIQDRLRRLGYTVLEAEDFQGFEFSMNGNPSGPAIRPKQAKLWYFSNEERSRGYILGTDFLTFQSTKYVDHEEFFAALLVGLQVVHEIVHLESVLRLGVRYLNAVVPGANESVDLYLSNSVHGVAVDGCERQFSASEAVFSTSAGMVSGTLIAKVFKAFGLIGFPADLVVKSIQVQERFQLKDQVSHAVIDMDHFSEVKLPLDDDGIRLALKALHDVIAVCFHSIATPHAFAKWE